MDSTSLIFLKFCFPDITMEDLNIFFPSKESSSYNYTITYFICIALLLNFPDLFYFWKMCTIWLHWKKSVKWILIFDFTHGPCIRDSTDAWTQQLEVAALWNSAGVYFPPNELAYCIGNKQKNVVESQGCPCHNLRNGWICYLT